MSLALQGVRRCCWGPCVASHDGSWWSSLHRKGNPWTLAAPPLYSCRMAWEGREAAPLAPALPACMEEQRGPEQNHAECNLCKFIWQGGLDWTITIKIFGYWIWCLCVVFDKVNLLFCAWMCIFASVPIFCFCSFRLIICYNHNNIIFIILFNIYNDIFLIYCCVLSPGVTISMQLFNFSVPIRE